MTPAQEQAEQARSAKRVTPKKQTSGSSASTPSHSKSKPATPKSKAAKSQKEQGAKAQPTVEIAKVSTAVLEYLHLFKYSPNGTGSTAAKRKRTKVPVSPVKSVSTVTPPHAASTSQQDESPTSNEEQPAHGPTTSSTSTSVASNSNDQPTPGPSSQSRTSPQHESKSSDYVSDSDVLSDLTDDYEEWVPEPLKRPRRSLVILKNNLPCFNFKLIYIVKVLINSCLACII
ncbi:hypothetical protein PoB_001736700 [Plakobranchus ocellatus]|uniref:Flocculation protein FLO11-like n=1 Tax=Plakobranchus ocellatus TaxID=259542 RepID=A0AAV3Z8M0_9GAST|nr:hypothetical protein PoB_001736700 [Plakobranchus ocellatus]